MRHSLVVFILLCSVLVITAVPSIRCRENILELVDDVESGTVEILEDEILDNSVDCHDKHVCEVQCEQFNSCQRKGARLETSTFLDLDGYTSNPSFLKIYNDVCTSSVYKVGSYERLNVISSVFRFQIIKQIQVNRKRKDEYDFIVSKQIEHCNSYWRNKVKEALDQKKYNRARDFANRAARKTPNYDEQFLKWSIHLVASKSMKIAFKKLFQFKNVIKAAELKCKEKRSVSTIEQFRQTVAELSKKLDEEVVKEIGSDEKAMRFYKNAVDIIITRFYDSASSMNGSRNFCRCYSFQKALNDNAIPAPYDQQIQQLMNHIKSQCIKQCAPWKVQKIYRDIHKLNRDARKTKNPSTLKDISKEKKRLRKKIEKLQSNKDSF
eukprot:gene11174-3995_t